MKRLVLVGTLIGAFTAGLLAQANQAGQRTPKAQPPTEAAPSAPTGEMALGSVRLPSAVKADGKPLAAGTYQMRLTAQAASPDAKGQSPSLERWVEFTQGGQVKGRELVSIVLRPDIDKVQKDSPPAPGTSKVQLLKGGEYYRVWTNRGGNYYLIHLVAT